MNNPESNHEGSVNAPSSKRSRSSKRKSTENSIIINRFGFRKQFGKAEGAFNTSAIHDPLIDYDAGSDDNEPRKRLPSMIPGIAEYSAIMANLSSLNPEQFN